MKSTLLVLFTLLVSISLQAQISYVKADATGANNGSSWTDAYTDLQDAIAAASYGTQVWVSVGTYKPTQDTNRDAYFELKNGVEIYGGFLGAETQLTERDYIHNETILSGDIGVVGDSLDNSYTIVYSEGTDENTILEGFTIEAGNANYLGSDVLDTNPKKSGGGAYLTGEMSDLRCQIKHCHFKNNHSDARGGGLFIWSGPASGSIRPNIFANEFTQNDAGTLGGGFYWIGGTYQQEELIPADSLIFNNNQANVGGGIHMTSRENSAVTKIRNCIFTENISSSVGGGFYFREDSFESVGLEFTGCDFIYNNSSLLGGGIFYGGFAEFKNVTLRDCYLDHNLAGTLENRLNGGGIYLEGYIDTPGANAKLLVENTTMSWNRGNNGGAIHPSITGSLTIEVKNSIFQYNSAAFSGGGIYTSNPDHIVRVYNTYFEGNTANDATGGGIHVQTNDVEITNCAFNANIGKTGAGIRMINGNVTNCVFYENNALQQGGGIRCSQAQISNSIFWNNVNFGTGPDIYNNSFPITVQSCLFSAPDCEGINYNNSNINCGGNTLFGIDPQFTNPDDNDFSTAPNSIVRDAGDDAFYPSSPTEDYFGNARFEGGSIDLGIYEIPAVSIASIATATGDCQEENINNGTLDYDIADGVTPLTFNIGDVEIITSEISGTLEGLAGGTYDFTVTDAVGNSATAPIVIPFLPQPTTDVEITNPTCNGYSNGVIILTATGETEPFSILWDNGVDNFGQYGVVGDDYAYTLTDAFGCQLSGIETVQEPDPIVITGTTQNVSCDGSPTGQITINPTGGTGDLTATWSPNPNNEDGYQLTNIPAGTYLVTIEDEVGCSFSSQYFISGGEGIEISATITDAGCDGSASGAITVTPAAGSGNLSYLWSNNLTSTTISNLVADDYTLTVTDSDGCFIVETYTVSAGTPLTFFPIVTQITCAGETDGSINLNIENPEELDIMWSSNVNGQTGSEIINLSADTYAVTVINTAGCEELAEFIVEEVSEIIANSTVQNTTCAGSTDGSVSFDITGGLPPYTITGETEDLGAGTYTVTISDANSCTKEVTFEIMDNTGLELNFAVTDAACPDATNGSVEVLITGGMPPYSIGGETTDLPAGEYTINVTDMSGCSATGSFTVSQPSPLNFDFDIVNAETASSSDGNIFIENITGGTAPYIFNWENGAMTEDLTDIPAGMYNLAITDENECSYNFGFDVDFNTAVRDLSDLGWGVELRPNVLLRGESAVLILETDRATLGKVQIYDAVGRLFVNDPFDISSGKSEYELDIIGLSAGVYFVRLETEFGGEVMRLVVVM